MKIIFTLASLLFLTSSSFSLIIPYNVASGNSSILTPSPSVCYSGAVPLLRAYNPSVTDHFYTANAVEMENAVLNLGYNSEGDTGGVFPSQVPYTTPLYRLNNPTISDHFYTTNAAERDNAAANLGYVEEGTTGYVYATQICGSQPLYRLNSVANTDHFYTLSASEVNNAVAYLGYTYEGIQAYVPPY